MTDNAQQRAKILRKIRALRHQSGRTEAEADAMMAKAAQLMADYDISVAEADDIVDRSEVGKTSRKFFVGNCAEGVLYLGFRVAPIFGCAASGWVGMTYDWDTRKDRRVCQVNVYGTEEKREMVLDLMATLLVPQMQADAARDKPRSRATYSRSWATSAAVKMLEAHQDHIDNTPGAALIPVDTRAQEMMEKAVTRTHRPTTHDYGSMSAGLQAGQDVNIGRAAVPDGPAQIGSGR